jgi:hypothetical protein
MTTSRHIQPCGRLDIPLTPIPTPPYSRGLSGPTRRQSFGSASNTARRRLMRTFTARTTECLLVASASMQTRCEASGRERDHAP